MRAILDTVRKRLGGALKGSRPTIESDGGVTMERQSETETDDESDAERRSTKTDVVSETGLTPEEYILSEIESRGEYVKQQEICAFTGWSDSCVSRTLSKMEEAGTITRIRIGREKAVSIPETSSERERSPSDDETESD